MQKNIFVRSVAIFLLLTALTACFPVSFDGPYKGRVIDAETGQPIEGVVVLGVWYKEHATAGGTVGAYYDAQETMTDARGEFEIRGQGVKFMESVFSSISEMHVLIFKAGYGHVGTGMWSSLKVDGGLMTTKVDWEKDRAIIPIKKLTMVERKKDGPPSRPAIPINKMRIVTTEINKERTETGLTPFELGESK